MTSLVALLTLSTAATVRIAPAQGANEITFNNRRAVLVASPHPRFVGNSATPLKGPPNDVRLIADLLRFKYGFQPRNIRIFGTQIKGYPCTPTASMKGVLESLVWLGRSTQKGDYGAFYYSGHAASISTPRRGGSGYTQFLLCDDGPVFDYQITHRLKGATGQISKVFDCCFAGGLSRSPRDPGSAVTKRVELRHSLPLIARRLEASQSERTGSEIPSPKANDTTLGSSDELTPSFEDTYSFGKAGELRLGEFTRLLYWWLWRASKTNASFGATKEFITSKMVPNGEVHQSPVLAPEQAGSRYVFAPPILRPQQVPVLNERLVVGAVAGIGMPQTLTDGQRKGAYRVMSTRWFDATVKRTGQKTAPHAFLPARPSDAPVERRRRFSRDAGFEAVDDIVFRFRKNAAGLYEGTVSDMPNTPIFTAPTRDEAERELKRYADQAEASATMMSYLAPLLAVREGIHLKASKRIVKVGDEAKIVLNLDEEGYVVLLGIEPSRRLTVLAPNWESSFQPLVGRDIHLRARRPIGRTTYIAIALPKPPSSPPPIGRRDGQGMIILAEEVRPFWAWLMREMGGTLETGSTTGVPDAFGNMPKTTRTAVTSIFVQEG